MNITNPCIKEVLHNPQEAAKETIERHTIKLLKINDEEKILKAKKTKTHDTLSRTKVKVIPKQCKLEDNEILPLESWKEKIKLST